MKCPDCGNRKLSVAISFTGSVACRFSDDEQIEVVEAVALDSQWDDESECECMGCGWSGQLRDLPGAASLELGPSDNENEQAASASPRKAAQAERVAEIKRLLRDGYCNPAWRVHIEFLLRELKLIQERNHGLQPDSDAEPQASQAEQDPEVSDDDSGRHRRQRSDQWTAHSG